MKVAVYGTLNGIWNTELLNNFLLLAKFKLNSISEKDSKKFNCQISPGLTQPVNQAASTTKHF